MRRRCCSEKCSAAEPVRHGAAGQNKHGQIPRTLGALLRPPSCLQHFEHRLYGGRCHVDNYPFIVLTVDILPDIVIMISHNTLYNLANGLGALAMVTVVVYHFVAINARYLLKESAGRAQ